MTTPLFGLSALAPAIAEAHAQADVAIAEMDAYASAPSWRGAVGSLLAIHRAPKHAIRAQLVFLGGLAGGAPPSDPRLVRFAAGIELLHLFLLVHDDVMDNAAQRRGRPTVRVALRQVDPTIDWPVARDLAIVMGNMLHVVAMRHLMPDGGTGGELAAKLVLDALCHTGAGQFQDLLGWRSIGDDETALRRALVDKTAYQAFASPFASGLALARADADVSPAIAWGCRMGLALQVLDDLSDLIAPPTLTGKDALKDMIEGRPSLPLLVLHERARGADRELVESLVGRGIMADHERAELHGLVDKYRVVDACAAYTEREISGADALIPPSYPEAARSGMRSVGEGLRAHLAKVVADAVWARATEEE